MVPILVRILATITFAALATVIAEAGAAQDPGRGSPDTNGTSTRGAAVHAVPHDHTVTYSDASDRQPARHCGMKNTSVDATPG